MHGQHQLWLGSGGPQPTALPLPRPLSLPRPLCPGGRRLCELETSDLEVLEQEEATWVIKAVAGTEAVWCSSSWSQGLRSATFRVLLVTSSRTVMNSPHGGGERGGGQGGGRQNQVCIAYGTGMVTTEWSG